MSHSNLFAPCAHPDFDRAMRLSRQIPNHPNPERARAVHEWAVALLRTLRMKP